jgi:hypothetical protein
MTQLLHKFSLESAKFNGQVLGFVLLIWLAVMICALTSIRSQPFTARQRRFWMVIVFFIPILGLLAYLPFSFRREDLPHMFLLKHDRQKREAALAKRPIEARSR